MTTTRDSGPCLACGDYDGSHDPGCPLDPADRPHAYKPRKVTASRAAASIGHDMKMKRGGLHVKPCDVCGGSPALVVHDVSPRTPNRIPSRWSSDEVWLASLSPLAL